MDTSLLYQLSFSLQLGGNINQFYYFQCIFQAHWIKQKNFCCSEKEHHCWNVKLGSKIHFYEIFSGERTRPESHFDTWTMKKNTYGQILLDVFQTTSRTSQNPCCVNKICVSLVLTHRGIIIWKFRIKFVCILFSWKRK